MLDVPTEQTLLLIKPDAVRARVIGRIVSRIEANPDWQITGLVMRQLSPAEAEEFYSIHRGKNFLAGLVEFMTSGPLIAMRIEGPEVRSRLRQLVGATDPAAALPGTIRAEFGTNNRMNAVHASNPDEDVERELRFFFSER